MAGPTTFNAPVHRVLGRGNPSNAGSGAYPNAAPGMEYLLQGLQDHRLPYNLVNSPAGTTGAGVLGWYAGGNLSVCNYVPAAAATANIAALANVASGVAMTLAAGTGNVALSVGAPVTMLPGSVMSPITPLIITSGICIDSLPSYFRFGSGGNFTTTFYRRSTIIGRCVSITGVSGGAGGTFLVSGYDCYGYPMSQLVTVAAGVNTVITKKAFKVVTSVLPNFTDAHNYSVGVADVFGFGILVGSQGDALINWNNAWLTSQTTFVAADTTSPATTTTGDVRGTFGIPSASDAAKRLFVNITASISSLSLDPTTGLFGQPQV